MGLNRPGRTVQVKVASSGARPRMTIFFFSRVCPSVMILRLGVRVGQRRIPSPARAGIFANSVGDSVSQIRELGELDSVRRLP